MNWLNKHLSFKADLMVTLLNGLVVVGGVFILNGLIARIHGLEYLGEFLLIKRTLSAIVGILLIGINIGLPYYLSRNFQKSYGDISFILFIIVTIPLTVILIVSILWFDITGFYSEHFWVYIVFSLSISAQFITYALYRGYMNMIGANIFQLLGTAIIPIIVFTIVIDLYEGLFWIGSCVLIMMIFAFILRNKGLNIHEINFHQSKKIVKYGLERIPSFFAQFILLAGVPLFLAQTVNFESVAYFNSSLSLVRLSLILVNPLGMVLLPRISNKIASGTMDDVANFLNIFLKAGIVFSVIGTAYCYINAPFILSFWLGEVSDAGITILRLTILALPFYTFSGLTRSPIDAVSEKGYNSLIYGLERIPSFVAQFILLAGIPLFLAQTVNFESVAYFISSLSLVRLSLIIVNPIGMVLLPRISNKIASGAMDDVANFLNIFLKAGIVFSVIGTAYFYINAPLILTFWLGEVSETGITILRLTILALPFYTFSGLTRSPIDAVSEKGYNSLIYGLAAVVLITIIFIGKTLGFDLLTTALVSFLISHIVAGLLSAFFIQRFYHSKLWNFQLIRDVVIGTLIIYLISHLFSLLNISAVTQFITTSVIYIIVGIIIFKFVKTGWLAELKSKLYAS